MEIQEILDEISVIFRDILKNNGDDPVQNCLLLSFVDCRYVWYSIITILMTNIKEFQSVAIIN